MFILILRVFYLLHKNLVCFINTLIYRCFTLCSDWSKCHRELVILKEIFQRNGYPKSFVNKCFKKFLDRLHIIKPTSATMEKKTLHLVLPYLGSISLQVWTKIRNAMENISNHSKLQVIFKNKRKLSNMFRFKDCVPYDLVSGVVYEYTCGRSNSSYYGKTERPLKVRSCKYIGISPLSKKRNRLKGTRYVTIFYNVIITLLLMSLPI